MLDPDHTVSTFGTWSTCSYSGLPSGSGYFFIGGLRVCDMAASCYLNFIRNVTGLVWDATVPDCYSYVVLSVL